MIGTYLPISGKIGQQWPIRGNDITRIKENVVVEDKDDEIAKAAEAELANIKRDKKSYKQWNEMSN